MVSQVHIFISYIRFTDFNYKNGIKNYYQSLLVIGELCSNILSGFLLSEFSRSSAIVAFVSVVPSFHRVFVGISCVRHFFLWVFHGFTIFSCGYFVGRNIFFLGISCIQDFFLWVLRESNFFRCVLFCDLKVFGCWLHEIHRNDRNT